jgi:hypothetical protein
MASGRITLVPLAAAAICAPAHAVVYLSVTEAQRLAFPDQALSAAPLLLSPAQIAAIEQESGVKVYSPAVQLWTAPDGYFIVDAVIGKHDLITYAVALSRDGRVRQVELLEYREAYGGEIRNPRWLAQFQGKQPGDPLRIGDTIQGISGATLSCEHVTDGVRRLLATYAAAIRDAKH